MRPRYIAYCRTSTENQREEKTIDLQVDDLTKFSQNHNLEIIEWFKDDGISGGLENRPALLRMMKFLEAEEDIKGVIIYKLDRLARDLYIQEGLIKEFNKLGKEVLSTLEPDLGSNDPFRKAFRQMLGVFAEFEKAMITLRMKNGRNSAVAKGGWHGGQIYGYDTRNGQLFINEQEAPIVRRIYHMKRYMRFTPSKIANVLNKETVPTKRKTTRWHSLTIRNILKNPIYRGTIRYKEQNYEGKHERIIS